MIYKIIILMSFGLQILLVPSSWLHETCNVDIAKQAVPPIIWYEQAIDGKEQPPLVTRVLHNKVGVFLNQFGKCYFQNIEPYLLYKTVGFIGLSSIFFLFYKAIDTKKYFLLALLTLVPTFPFFGLPTSYQILLYKLLSVVGVFLLLKNSNGKK